MPSDNGNARPDILTQLRAELEDIPWCGEGGLFQRAADEIEDLRTSVIAFGAPWMVKYAQDWGLPPKHLDPRHYDILKRAGARMDDFIRGSATND